MTSYGNKEYDVDTFIRVQVQRRDKCIRDVFNLIEFVGVI